MQKEMEEQQVWDPGCPHALPPTHWASPRPVGVARRQHDAREVALGPNTRGNTYEARKTAAIIVTQAKEWGTDLLLKGIIFNYRKQLV